MKSSIEKGHRMYLGGAMEHRLENPKWMDIPRARVWREDLRASGRSLVLTNGIFDLLHTGHIYYLQKARCLGDALLVALNSDASTKLLKGPLRPVQDEVQRAYALAALACVDAVLVFREPRLTPELLELKPDIYCKAGDYTLDKLDPGERAALQEVGSQIVFLPFLKGFSTTQLITRIRAAGSL